MKRAPILALIFSNTLPLFGVLFFDWSLFSIMFLYWLESGVIGLFNIPKILKASGSEPPPPPHIQESYEETNRVLASFEPFKKIGLRITTPKEAVNTSERADIPFFLLHYGIFMAVHLVFIYTIFGPADLPLKSLAVALVSLLFSHGLSFALNFIGNKEYERVTKSSQFSAPYKRIVILHLTIVLGAGISQVLNNPVGFLIFMIILKTSVDIFFHIQEHKHFYIQTTIQS